MLDGKYLTGLGEVEHIKNDGFRAPILSTMDSTDYFDQRFAFVESAFATVLANDYGQ